jgi:hypothetical protein
MNESDKTRSLHFLGYGLGILLFSLANLGCEGGSAARQESSPPPAQASEETAQSPEKLALLPEDTTKQDNTRDAKKVEVGKNVWLEVQGDKRRVIVQAEVCLRDGMLEQLMCRKRTKEHEAILAADVDARDIHKALILAKATPGTPVKSKGDTVIPPTGTKIKITLSYKDKDKQVTVPGRDWVRDMKTKKSLEHDWVFVGSYLMDNPLEKDKPPLYAANSGDVICVSNFVEAMLDLPINSSKNNAELEFEAFTERIPPLGTPVTVTLEPVLETKKK